MVEEMSRGRRGLGIHMTHKLSHSSQEVLTVLACQCHRSGGLFHNNKR